MLGWSEEENARLCLIVKSYVEEKGFSPDGLSLYQRIAPMFPGHQFQELRRHYLKKLQKGRESPGPAVASKTGLNPSQSKTKSGSSQKTHESSLSGKSQTKQGLPATQGSKTTLGTETTKESQAIDKTFPCPLDEPITQQQSQQQGPASLDPIGKADNVEGDDDTELVEDVVETGSAQAIIHAKSATPLEEGIPSVVKDEVGMVEMKREARRVTEVAREGEMDQLSKSGPSITTHGVSKSKTKTVAELSLSCSPRSSERPLKRKRRWTMTRRNVATEEKKSSEGSSEDPSVYSDDESSVYSDAKLSIYPDDDLSASTLQPSVNQPLPLSKEETADYARNSQPKSLQADATLTQEESHLEILRNKPLSEETSALCRESVDVLSRLTGQDRNAVLHGLLVSSGDVRVAFDYLCRRNPQSTWSYDEDIAILNRQEDKLHLMIETKSLDEIAARFGFLTSLCEAPPV